MTGTYVTPYRRRHSLPPKALAYTIQCFFKASMSSICCIVTFRDDFLPQDGRDPISRRVYPSGCSAANRCSTGSVSSAGPTGDRDRASATTFAAPLTC
ncbi:hypothetical protein OUZ56_001532 [Daphnia magna]|uniref:Uncharacterized protein n=1 Tax=Daphnia magna TaxID=35525 RepID=A0ABR0A2Z1_9CRUS|nr:hypothetical protein OUZ56_001532 [Daphnia magna]